MAGRFPNRADFDIPIDIIYSHEWMADELIDGPTGQQCDLIYPTTKNTVCPNCIFDPRAQRSSGMYKAGGPVPFPNHTTCPWCGGVGRSSRASTETIRLRVYWRESDWRQLGGGGRTGVFEDPQNSCMVIGYMTDLPKLEQADRVLVNKDLKGMRRWMCERMGEAKPHGLAQNRYFIQMLQRTGGG